MNAGRKMTMLIAALLIVPTMFAPAATNMWMAVLIVGVAAAAHQWWSANIFTLASDMFPRFAVGSVVGIGGFIGAAGGFFFQRATGWLLQHNGSNYTPMFIVCGFAYVRRCWSSICCRRKLSARGADEREVAGVSWRRARSVLRAARRIAAAQRIRIRWIRFASCRGIARRMTRCTVWRRRGSAKLVPRSSAAVGGVSRAVARAYTRDTAAMGRELRAGGRRR